MKERCIWIHPLFVARKRYLSCARNTDVLHENAVRSIYINTYIFSLIFSLFFSCTIFFVILWKIRLTSCKKFIYNFVKLWCKIPLIGGRFFQAREHNKKYKYRILKLHVQWNAHRRTVENLKRLSRVVCRCTKWIIDVRHIVYRESLRKVGSCENTTNIANKVTTSLGRNQVFMLRPRLLWKLILISS